MIILNIHATTKLGLYLYYKVNSIVLTKINVQYQWCMQH